MSVKDIRNRIRSMESTHQITKAMELVASSRLRQAQAKVLTSRTYFEVLHTTVHDIVNNSRDLSSPFLTKREGNRALYVVIAGDRGLAGGYNSNIFKLCLSEMEGKDAAVLPIGKKAVEFFQIRGQTLLTDAYGSAAEVTVGDCFSIAKQLCGAYLDGGYDEITLGYTCFVSVLSQTPRTLPLLPIIPQTPSGPGMDTIYEPSAQEVFAAIVPQYLGGILYGALCEARGAEQAARRTAMDSATRNAGDMIADLSLKYNRARQGAITNEIIDIVSGAND